MIRILLISSLLATPAYALERLNVTSSQQQTAVVELFTSEGCSSCPPADRWFEAMVQLPRDEIDVLALAFHVDYWDYLGWKDRFSSPRYTSRQRRLGANNSQRTIYTPEFFVDGVEARGTSKVLDKVRRSNRNKASVKLELSVSKISDSLQLELRTTSPTASTQTLNYQYFVYENHLMSDVKRGENAGKQLTHQQVVRYMSPKQPLKEVNLHSIRIAGDWELNGVGVAALVTSQGEDIYLQAVHTPILPLLGP